MAQPPPTSLYIEPPEGGWDVTPRNGRSTPVIATGHQPYFWHPGILAKDIAVDRVAQQVGGSSLHIVVDHNAQDPLAIDVPVVSGRVLSCERVVLDPRADATLPPNCLPAIDTGQVRRVLESAGPMVGRVAEAYGIVKDAQRLSSQTAAVLDVLKRPYLNAPMPMRSTAGLVIQAFVDRLLADPIGCVRAYNRAVKAYPEAGIRPLYAGREVVEAPLWAQGDAGPTPVYVDLCDSKRPLLLTQGQSLDLAGEDSLPYLRPRAATLSALMRSEHCDLFIHGKGGGVYDRVTERWWRDWTGEQLAPMAVVSADVCLSFDVPIMTSDEARHAVWFNHTLPFNVDRYVEINDDNDVALQDEKRELLDRMNDDRNKRRRDAAFKRIHAINDELKARHLDPLRAAKQQAEDARLGVNNLAVAHRRDWCFALYPTDQITRLAEQIHARLVASCG